MFDTIGIAREFQGAAKIGILQMDGVQVRESSEELKGLLGGLAEDCARRYQGQPLGEIATEKKSAASFTVRGWIRLAIVLRRSRCYAAPLREKDCISSIRSWI